ncbi:hypothetical protein RI367_000108 [Sorochytrium milnesiophthora]
MGTPGDGKSLVLIVLHGMGAQKWLPRNVEGLKESIASLLSVELAELSNIDRVDVLPIEYHSILHGLESTDQRARAIRLPTCIALRSVINDYMCDPLYYFTFRHGRRLRKIVARLLNGAFDDYLRDNGLTRETFRGTVAILSHSMGGIVTWDLLDNDRRYRQWKAGTYQAQTVDQEKDPVEDIVPINFPVSNVFCMGSPVGNTLVLRGHDVSDYEFAPHIAFWNIFHPLDPIAFRLEPLFDLAYTHIPAVSLPPYNNKPFHVRLKENFNASLSSLSSSLSPLGALQLPQLTLPQLSVQLPPIQMPQMPGLPVLPPMFMPQIPRPSFVLASGVDRATRSVRSLMNRVAAVTKAGQSSFLEYTLESGEFFEQQAGSSLDDSNAELEDGYASDTEQDAQFELAGGESKQRARPGKRKRRPASAGESRPILTTTVFSTRKRQRQFGGASSSAVGGTPVSPPLSDQNQCSSPLVSQAVAEPARITLEKKDLGAAASNMIALDTDDGSDTSSLALSETENQGSEIFNLLSWMFSPFSRKATTQPRLLIDTGQTIDECIVIGTIAITGAILTFRFQRHEARVVDTAMPLPGGKLVRSRPSQTLLPDDALAGGPDFQMPAQPAGFVETVEEVERTGGEVTSSAQPVTTADRGASAVLGAAAYVAAKATELLGASPIPRDDVSSAAAAATNEDDDATAPPVPENELPRRIDYVLPCALVDSMTNEYIVGLRAHFSYWYDADTGLRNKDMMWFILRTLNEQIESKASAETV